MKIFKSFVLLAGAFTLTLSATIMTAQAQSLATKATQLVKWQFSKTSGEGWTSVTVPHSCNAMDGHSPSYYRGKTYYKTPIMLTDAQVKKPLFILFEGAAQAAEVSVNGRHVTTHKGAYTPFVISLVGLAKTGENEVVVMCDNKEDINLIPVTSDFNKNNGLHNAVYLLEMSDVYASPYPYGLYRLHVSTPSVTNSAASTQVATRIMNSSSSSRSLRLTLTLTDAKGKAQFRRVEKVTIAAGDSLNYLHSFTLNNPHLWNGTADPYLYKVRIAIADASGRALDQVETLVGYRYYRMDADKGFFLNGHSYPLRGVCMHQDWDQHASALLKENTDKDYDIVKELGANFLRLAHYPHNDYEYTKCDQLGIVVQTEVPWVNVCGVNANQIYFDNIHQQMREMITNLYNHPSIVFWGMWNELDGWGNNDKLQGKADYALVAKQTDILYNYAKTLDPYRKVGMSDCSLFQREPYKTMKGDYFSENHYDGWYYGTFADFIKNITNIHKLMGITNVSEYGCGNDPYCHHYDSLQINNKDNARHYEEYANLYHEEMVRQIKQMSFLNFTSVWILYDFAVASRKEGYMDSDDGVHFTENEARMYTNDKGLVTRDRKTKKDAFYLYKSLWNHHVTTVYITSRRLAKRPAGTPFRIKVYSNAKSLTLYQNGNRVQTLSGSGEETKVIWTFRPVTLQSQKDTFRVVASDGTTDTVVWECS